MPNLYDLEQGHTKPATDTKERDFVGRGGDSAYPIGARVTAVNGDDTYDCIEVSALGVDATTTHSDVPNIGDATLVVNDICPLFKSNNLFFFAKRRKFNVISYHTTSDSGNDISIVGSGSTYQQHYLAQDAAKKYFRVTAGATGTVNAVFRDKNSNVLYEYVQTIDEEEENTTLIPPVSDAFLPSVFPVTATITISLDLHELSAAVAEFALDLSMTTLMYYRVWRSLAGSTTASTRLWAYAIGGEDEFEIVDSGLSVTFTTVLNLTKV
jgi:hypothetical protein